MENIGIIAPAGNIEDIEKLSYIKSVLENFGMKVKIFPCCYKNLRYMAGNDNTRLNDLHNAFLDHEIDTIIAARGGYGTLRLLDKIDYNIIKNNPKKIIGSSDITALLISIYKHTNQITYHAKMAINGIPQMNKAEFENYKNAIENNAYTMPDFTRNIQKNTILWGGNLATIVSMFGAPAETYVPDKDITLFIEDINEPDYKIDKMLTQILRNKPLSSKIKGVIFGEFMGAGKYLDEILKEFAATVNIPYAYDPKITHGKDNTVVPIGLGV